MDSLKNLASPRNIDAPQALWIVGVSKRVAELALIAAAYFGSARLGLLLALENTNASPVWPPSGIAFAAMLLFGYRIWPAITIGAFLANAVVFSQNEVAGLGTILAASFLVAVGNTLEALSGAFLIRRFVRTASPFDGLRDVLKFLEISLLMCLTSSVIGPAGLSLFRIIPWVIYPTVWLTWWMGDVVGILVLTPALVLFLQWYQQPVSIGQPKRLVEGGLLFLLLYVTSQFIFGEGFGVGRAHQPVDFLIISFMLWAAFRLGQGGVALTAVAVSSLAIAGTLKGFGPFVRETQNESLLLLQAFLGTVSVTGLIVATLMKEHERWEEALQKSSVDLERKVRDRTAELRAANESLTKEILERKETETRLRAAYQELERSQEVSLNIMEDLDRERKELRRTNEALLNEMKQREQLELFTHVASHDLQEPLHNIIGFGELLQDQKTGLDATARDYVQRMTRSATRMSQLIQDLISFSRVSTKKDPLRPVDLKEAVREALKNVELRIQETRAQVTIGDLPGVQGDPAQLQQLFQNFITNALKFRKRGGPPEIEIQGRILDDRWAEVTIRDHGIGFEQEHLERIFRPFERLHSRSEYEGSGMGLAICQKIVARHGGKITARGEPGKGAAFTVTLLRSKEETP